MSRVKQPTATLLLVIAASLSVAAAAPPRARRPVAVAVARDGTIVIADAALPGIVRRGPDGTISEVFRASNQHRAPLRATRALAIGTDGGILAADSASSEVYRLEAGRDPAPIAAGSFEVPTGLAVAEDGSIVVADLRLDLVGRVPKGGGATATIATVVAPRAVAIDRDGSVVVLAMRGDQLIRLDAEGRPQPIVRGRPFRLPLALLADGDRFLVSDGDAATIFAVARSGQVTPFVRGAPLVRPAGLARDHDGSLLVADPGAGQVFRVSQDGAVRLLLDSPAPAR
ncbi:MAG TPA: hypothetical protein VG406_05800 [Isosphaeraceae bacterium]|jgi:glucose/arabinose dehydrogenase|nr:hypothetical protein [Isosphaeraceae bacterium]